MKHIAVKTNTVCKGFGAGETRAEVLKEVNFEARMGELLISLSQLHACFLSLTVLLAADPFHPVHNLAVERLLNGDVCHGCCWRSAMPMFQSWGKPDDIAGTNLLDRTALALHPTETACNNERLTKRMRVPRCASSRLERDTRTGGACWRICLKQRIDSNRASEPISRSLRGCLRADSFDFHI